MLSLETINQKLLGFMQSTGIYRTTCEKHFLLIDEKLSRDYTHLNRLDHEIKNAPAKRRKFWVTVLAHTITVLTSIGGMLALFKTGAAK
jgi:DNA transposition AAA+ family ATPase